MPEKAIETQAAKSRVSFYNTGGIARNSLAPVVAAGEYVQQRMTTSGAAYVHLDSDDTAGTDATTSMTMQGGVASAAIPAPVAEGAAVRQSMTLNGEARVTGEFVGINDTAAPTDVAMVGALVSAAAPAPTAGDIASLSVNAANELRVVSESVEGTVDSAAPARRMVIAGRAETTIGTAVADGDVVDLNVDEYGRIRDADHDYGSNSKLVTDIAPAIASTILGASETLNDPDDLSTAYNISGYGYVGYRITATGVEGAGLTVRIRLSDDNTSFGCAPLEDSSTTGIAITGANAVISTNDTFIIWTKCIRGAVYASLQWFAGGSPAATVLTVVAMIGR